jgi:hypothetical protein
MSDRVAALVAALLGVRIDHASARFDAEIDAALAANALDVQTARALRFWQRASVQAVEDYTAGVLPVALAARGDADRQGLDDVIEAAAAWEKAQTAQEAHAAQDVQAARPAPIRNDSTPDAGPRHRSVSETEQAVRAALRTRNAQGDGSPQFEGKDSGHARSTTSA